MIASAEWTHITETVKHHKGWTAASLGLSLIPPAVGYLVGQQVVGAPVGIALFPVSLWVRGKTPTRVRTITTSSSS